ncbi:MAG TPA: hypothetical protein VK436_13550 [Methanocella sp.]|nr:hypothetical protein [Methanocella sp.]
MITKKYEGAKKAAIEEFKIAEKQELVEKPPPPLCCIFGDKNSEFKIRDMMENARKSVYCRTSERYMGYVKKFVKKGITLRLIIMSDGDGPQKQMETLFKTGDVCIRTVSIDQIMDMAGPAEKEAQRKMSSIVDMPDMENMFLLVVDDTEALMVIPIKSNSLNAITSTNGTVVYMMKRWIELNDTANKPPDNH